MIDEPLPPPNGGQRRYTEADLEVLHTVGPPRLFVRTQGSGPLILFLHGIGGNSSNWRAQLQAFGPAGFRAAAWDARGYGRSDDNRGSLHFTDFVDDVARALDHFGEERAHLVGLSMGGRIALVFAHRHPERVASLTLADTSAGAVPDPAKIEAFLAKRLAPMMEGKTPGDIAPQLVEEIAGPNASAEARAELLASHQTLERWTYVQTLRAVTAFHDFPSFESIQVPTLVIVGSEDRIARPEHARVMAERIPNARLVVLEGAGHVSNVEQPAAFNAALASFLNGLP